VLHLKPRRRKVAGLHLSTTKPKQPTMLAIEHTLHEFLTSRSVKMKIRNAKAFLASVKEYHKLPSPSKQATAQYKKAQEYIETATSWATEVSEPTQKKEVLVVKAEKLVKSRPRF
jgi:hypothetical protein